ncbi:hypothetical protein M0R45_006937 [Rubus argutus]|uniref:Uncharacterized protein n=1 Tax=Rubus argutus TaxID=59490 RepID=A0AAW1YSM0_RUBAR
MVSFEQQGPTEVLCDNIPAIKFSKNPILHGRSKHIDVRYHFSRDLYKDGVIDIVHCKSEDQIADVPAVSQLLCRDAPEAPGDLKAKAKVRCGRRVPTEYPPTLKLVLRESKQSQFERGSERTCSGRPAITGQAGTDTASTCRYQVRRCL